MYVVMGVDIKIKKDGNDLEFNIIKDTRNVEMHRRKRKYYKTIPGVIIMREKEAPGAQYPERLDTDLSHYHGYIEIPETVDHKGLPYTVTQLEESLMKQGVDVYGITIPGTVETIPSEAFLNCWRLEYARLNEGIKIIDYFAFGGCYTLREVVFPDSMKHLGQWSFVMCKNLTSITLGTGMRNMVSCFQLCPNIRTIICKAETPPRMAEKTFDEEIFENAVVHVPAEFIPNYRDDYYWKDFKTIVAI